MRARLGALENESKILVSQSAFELLLRCDNTILKKLFHSTRVDFVSFYSLCEASNAQVSLIANHCAIKTYVRIFGKSYTVTESVWSAYAE